MDAPGINVGTPCLWAGACPGGWVVQVTEGAVRVMGAAPSWQLLHEWRPQHGELCGTARGWCNVWFGGLWRGWRVAQRMASRRCSLVFWPFLPDPSLHLLIIIFRSKSLITQRFVSSQISPTCHLSQRHPALLWLDPRRSPHTRRRPRQLPRHRNLGPISHPLRLILGRQHRSPWIHRSPAASLGPCLCVCHRQKGQQQQPGRSSSCIGFKPFSSQCSHACGACSSLWWHSTTARRGVSRQRFARW